jgi:hypothetical protein
MDTAKILDTNIDRYPTHFCHQMKLALHQKYHDFPKSPICKIAFIPMDVLFPDEFEEVPYAYLDDKDGAKILRINNKKSKKLFRWFKNTAQESIKEGANIIVYSEYSYPTIYDAEMKKFFVEFCEKNKCYVIAGSYVEYDDLKNKGFNRCLIFTPHNGSIVTQNKNSRGAFSGENENIKTPLDKEVRLINTKYGTIAVALCIDAQDQNLIKNISVANRSDNLYKPIDIIVVPSYTDEPNTIYSNCETLSITTRTCVVYVCDSTFGHHSALFINGVKIKEPDIKKIKRPKLPIIYISKLDLFRLRSERLKYFNTKCFEPITVG